MMTGFAIAVHELLWFGTYFIVHPNAYDVWMNLLVYGSFIAFAAEGLFVFKLLHFFEKFNMKVLAIGMGAVGLYYAAWASIGYPLTLDLKTGMAFPAFYGNLFVDFIEFGSWLLMFFAVGAAYYAKRKDAK